MVYSTLQGLVNGHWANNMLEGMDYAESDKGGKKQNKRTITGSNDRKGSGLWIKPLLLLLEEWMPQLNLKKFEAIGSEAKKRMKDAFRNQNDFLHCIGFKVRNWTLYRVLKKRLSLERFKERLSFGFWAHFSRHRNSVKSTIFRVTLHTPSLAMSISITWSTLDHLTTLCG
ncbi:hypothetical protein DdX_16395 [Ditylenchus destructor]|uniref:Uncharacterized protein n=1 Tax=Ditylenchus destructor TaxID=166010 RepID=A0AAD4MP30_9BILA|nr:hypothetical protein DdX_16395 [Ditylenchus destructor]